MNRNRTGVDAEHRLEQVLRAVKLWEVSREFVDPELAVALVRDLLDGDAQAERDLDERDREVERRVNDLRRPRSLIFHHAAKGLLTGEWACPEKNVFMALVMTDSTVDQHLQAEDFSAFHRFDEFDGANYPPLGVRVEMDLSRFNPIGVGQCFPTGSIGFTGRFPAMGRGTRRIKGALVWISTVRAHVPLLYAPSTELADFNMGVGTLLEDQDMAIRAEMAVSI